MSIQDWFPLGLIGLSSLQFKVQAPCLLKIQRSYKGLKALHYPDPAAFLTWSSPTLSTSHFFLVTLPPPSLNTPDTRSPQNFARSVSSTFLYVAYNQASSVTLIRYCLWPVICFKASQVALRGLPLLHCMLFGTVTHLNDKLEPTDVSYQDFGSLVGWYIKREEEEDKEVPGCSVVRPRGFHCQGPGVWFIVKELKSQGLCGEA